MFVVKEGLTREAAFEAASTEAQQWLGEGYLPGGVSVAICPQQQREWLRDMPWPAETVPPQVVEPWLRRPTLYAIPVVWKPKQRVRKVSVAVASIPSTELGLQVAADTCPPRAREVFDNEGLLMWDGDAALRPPAYEIECWLPRWAILRSYGGWNASEHIADWEAWATAWWAGILPDVGWAWVRMVVKATTLYLEPRDWPFVTLRRLEQWLHWRGYMNWFSADNLKVAVQELAEAGALWDLL